MIRMEHYTKRYKKETACSNITFTVPDGSTTVLLGPNGAGKTTVMKGICGFLQFEGNILINGEQNNTPASRRAIGYMPEIPVFYPNLTVSEHIEFTARVYRLKDYRRRAETLAERLELGPHMRKLGCELSKGMAQKLSICLGFMPSPSVVLLDEPFIGLDPYAIKELKSIISEERGKGASIMISTHIIDSVDTLWDQTVILEQGRQEACVSRAEMEASGKSLEELFFSVTDGNRRKTEKGRD